MNNTQKLPPSKINYEAPSIDIVRFFCTDIIITSGCGDENQGEWDPQAIDNEPIW